MELLSDLTSWQKSQVITVQESHRREAESATERGFRYPHSNVTNNPPTPSWLCFFFFFFFFTERNNRGKMAASPPSSLLLPLGSVSGKSHQSATRQGASSSRCSNLEARSVRATGCKDNVSLVKRRDVMGLGFGVSLSSLLLATTFLDDHDDAKAAGLPPEQKPKLCDDACEKELENVPMVTTESGLQYKDIKVGEGPCPPVGFQVAANYVAMVPSGQIFDSSLEKGQLYIFRVGSGQVIKGLDEGILSMKVGGKRRLYIPGSLAFPKGLTSAPGRPRVGPNSPVIFDVSLEYIPGLELEEE